MINGKKGNIAILIDPLAQKQKWVSPNDLNVYIGTVKTDEKGNKTVSAGTLTTLGVFLSEKDDEITELKKEVNDLKVNYRKNIKKLVDVLNILVGQTELNALDLNELLDMEDN